MASNYQAQYLGGSGLEEILPQPTPNPHKIAKDLGLLKVAENRYICPATQDFWEVEEGKVFRLSSDQVDLKERLTPSDAEKPDTFLASLLDELEF